jgi:hypothetical protein
MYLCVRGINVPIQGSEQSCICVLDVSIYQHTNTWLFTSLDWYIDTSNTQIHDCSLPWIGILIPLTHKHMTVHFLDWYIDTSNTQIHDCSLPWIQCTNPGKWAVMYLCVRGINVSIQGSEQSCICVLEVSMYQSREVSSHVFVYKYMTAHFPGLVYWYL